MRLMEKLMKEKKPIIRKYTLVIKLRSRFIGLQKGIYKLRPYNNLVNFVFYCVAIPLGFIIAIASVYSIGLIVKKKE